MSTPQLDRLQTYCQRLRLYQVATELPTLLEQAAKQDRAYSDFVEDLLSREVQAKGAKHLTMRLAMARFPFQKTLEQFDFKFQPSIDVKVLRELATGATSSTARTCCCSARPAWVRRIWRWRWA